MTIEDCTLKKIKLTPKTNKAKQIINRDGCNFELIGESMDVQFSERKDWLNLQSIDNPKNGRWIQRKNDINFDWEFI